MTTDTTDLCARLQTERDALRAKLEAVEKE